MMRIAEPLLEKGKVFGVQRHSFTRLAADEAGHSSARRQTLLDSAFEAAQIRIREAIQRTAAVIAGDHFIIGKRNHHGVSRRNAAHQQSADLRSARSERAEIFHRLLFETIY